MLVWFEHIQFAREFLKIDVMRDNRAVGHDEVLTHLAAGWRGVRFSQCLAITRESTRDALAERPPRDRDKHRLSLGRRTGTHRLHPLLGLRRPSLAKPYVG